MKKKNRVVFAALFGAFLLFPGLAAADVNIELYVQGPEGSIIVSANTSLSVPETCTVQDSGGGTHDFSEHKAPCAIQAAKEEGLIESFVLKDFGEGLGLFLDSVNGIATGPAPEYPFWNLWLNAELSDVGISEISLSGGDALQLTYGPWQTEIISSGSSVPGGCCGAPTFLETADAESMAEFLASQQKEDGSFGNALFSDWAAVALGAFGPERPTAENLKAYLQGNPDPGVSLGSSVLSFERRAMALMALGIDPYSGTSTNYIEKIAQTYDGEQIGDKSLVNDDIFALLVLKKAGYPADLEMMQNITSFVIGQQDSRGSFGSVDMTAAAVQALDLMVPSSREARESIEKVKTYLKSQQADEGGFGNPDSTSWAMQAISVFGHDWRSWVREGTTPGEYLASLQKEDGSMESAVPVWSTAYALPAVLGKPWGEILSAFERPAPVVSQESAPPQEPQEPQESKPAVLALEPAVLKTKEPSSKETLERVKGELNVIEGKVAVLELRVGLVYAEFQLERKQRQLALLPPLEEQKEEVVPAVAALSLNEGKGFTAEAASVAPGFFSSVFGRFLLVLAASFALFLLFGGGRLFAPFFSFKRSTLPLSESELPQWHHPDEEYRS